MENIKDLVKQIDGAVTAISPLSASQCKPSVATEIVACVLIVFLAVSISKFPEWVSYFVLVAIAVCVVCSLVKRRNCSDNGNGEVERIAQIRQLVDAISRQAEQLQADVASKNGELKSLEQKVGRLQEENRAKEQTIIELQRKIDNCPTAKQPPVDDIYRGKFNILLKAMQQLDVAVQDFGDECHEYVRNEVEKAAKMCGYRFVDYSEEMAECYEVEKVADLPHARYISRAVLSNSTDTVFIKGHIYIPEN